MVKQNFLLTVITGIAFVVLVREYAPSTWGPMQAAGLCLCIAGFVLWTVARFQLGSSLSVSAKARQLVSRGLYSRIRNPIYVFGSCTIAGLILILERPRWLLVFLAIIPMQIWRARKEAAVLEAAFGDEYRAYRSATWF
jgi:protein-S-isoprenylcysteine O-methyltransferase Ste14